MDLCRFFHCDMDKMTMPSWPMFTIVDPVDRADEIAGWPWPGTVASLFEPDEEHPEPPGVSALACDARTLVKSYGGTLDALRATLAGRSGVMM